MKTKNMDIGDKILFILGMSLFGVLFFVLVVGVIVALLVSWEGKKQADTSDTYPLQDKEEVRRQ